jgi:aminomethyltransferase
MTKKTVLYDRHVSAGAKIVDFAGWLMPVQYAGVLAEHSAVRNKVGIFDVSHMGEIFITGPDAGRFTDMLMTNDMSHLSDGQVRYTVMCDDEGNVIDDLIVYRMSPQVFMLVVNASNTEKDFNWITTREGRGNASVLDRSGDFGMLAVQGPNAIKTTAKVISIPEPFKRNRFFVAEYEGTQLMVSRTGYTGEDGVEIIAVNDVIVKLWDAVLEAGRDYGIAPAGLAVRDLLRIESGYSLYGHELDEKTDPLSAGLSWVVKMEGREFIGKKALQNLKPTKKRISFMVEGKSIPRQGCKLLVGGKEAGVVTSGTFSPALQKPIGIGYISIEELSALPKGGLRVEIRGKELPAEIYKPAAK